MRAAAGPLCRLYRAAGEPARLLPGIEAWRAQWNDALGARIARPLAWREDVGGEVHERDLGPAGWIALCLWAVYAERTDLELPDTVPPLLEFDRVYRDQAEAKFERSRYGQILAPRLWLPAEFAFTCRGPLPDGEQAEIGSLPVLCDQLRWLNQRTFQADEVEVQSWLALPAAAGGDLVVAARRGLACMLDVAQWGQRRTLPLQISLQ